MSDSLFIAEYLEQYFDELTPKEFYRNIFPAGELAAHKDKQEKGKYNAIAVELLPKEEDKVNARRYIITDELDTLDELLQKDNFIIVSPISYAGRSRKAENARYIYVNSEMTTQLAFPTVSMTNDSLVVAKAIKALFKSIETMCKTLNEPITEIADTMIYAPSQSEWNTVITALNNLKTRYP